MNKLEGHISAIETSGNLSVVHTTINQGLELKAIVIANPETSSYLEKGRKVSMLFKETELIISTSELGGISLQNKIPAIIQSIEKGALLSKVLLATAAGDIRAVISTSVMEELELKEQLKVVAMVKLNEVMISEL